MNLALKILIGVLSSGALASGTWVIYDFSNPTLAKQYKEKWNPITLTINKPPEAPSEESYSGSSCFQRFFGIEIQKFSINSIASFSGTGESISKNLFFQNTDSDIYGCAVGNEKFYELVLKNDKVGFATWLQNDLQKTLFLKKEENSWQIEKGISTAKKKDIDQIKSKTSKGSFSWFFMMDKETAKDSANNMQDWDNSFKGDDSNGRIYKDNEWKLSSSSIEGGGKIPKFEKVQDLTNLCNEQGYTRNHTIKGEDEEKLKVFCLIE